MRVLIGDDDRMCARLLAEQVTDYGAEVAGVVNSGGLEVIQKNHVLRPDVVMVDLKMQHFNGLTVCRTILSRYPREKVVLVTGFIEPNHPLVIDCGACALLAKPWTREQLHTLLNRLAADELPVPAECASLS